MTLVMMFLCCSSRIETLRFSSNKLRALTDFFFVILSSTDFLVDGEFLSPSEAAETELEVLSVVMLLDEEELSEFELPDLT